MPVGGVPQDAGEALDRARAAMTELIAANVRVAAARAARDAAIVEALAAGLSLGEVARQLRLSKSLVRLTAQAAGPGATPVPATAALPDPPRPPWDDVGGPSPQPRGAHAPGVQNANFS